MKHEGSWNTSDTSSPDDDTREAEDYIWATNEETKLRALSLYVIRSIVEKHGGSMDVDLATDTINIDVPAKEQAACAQEIEARAGPMCH